MKKTVWMRTAVVALLCTAAAQGQTPVPKEIEAWQAWVQDGQEFRRCPFFANTDGSSESHRVCAWPGRLGLDLNQHGGRFTQTWLSYAEAWVPLPGNLEYWPGAVTVNGVAAAVVARDGIPQIWAAPGTSVIAGSFAWIKRPESLPIPTQIGLVSLNLDGHPIEQTDRPDDAVWLGKRRDEAVPQQLELQVYRLLSDGSPAILETLLNLLVAGDAREETLSTVLPPGFEPMSLESELPAQIGADGRLRVQVRAGNWTVKVAARAATDPEKITVPEAQGTWPKQEVWSFAADDRLRIAALEGGEGIDPAQANVPGEWRRYPSYRIATGGVLHVNERSRGISPQEADHLSLHRELYLDFTGQGFTAIDRISGQMRMDWRLDMRSPYRLMRASSGRSDLLITEASDASLTGVELRTPNVSLMTAARIAVPRGALPASGWNERFDQVSGVLNLPPGHRLLAAIGVDSAPDSWVGRWGLLDLFLLSLTSVIALRLFRWRYAAMTFAAVALVNQEDPLLVWLLLIVLLAAILMRSAPAGWPRSTATWARNLVVVALLVNAVPFAITQLRFALYPQLADASMAQALSPARERDVLAKSLNAPPPPGAANYAAHRMESIAPSSAMAASDLQEMTVTGAKRSADARSAAQISPQRFAPGTLVQAGPGVPHWRFVAYPFSWSGPVDPAQKVHFLILPPWVVGLWRVLGVVLLVALVVRLIRGNMEWTAGWQRWFSMRGAAASSVLLVLACTVLNAPSRASSTPDDDVLKELKARLTRPAKCVPNCAEIMAARIVVTPTGIDASFDVGALSSVAVALPSAGERFDPDAVAVDGIPVPGLYRDGDQQLWIALKPGAHTVKMSGHLPTGNSIQLLFPQVPRAITVSGEGWDISGVNAGRLLGNTVELLRRRAADREAGTPQSTAQFPPYVRIRREFSLDLDWTVQTTAERLAPEKGGFTVEIPLLAGESVLTNGIETNNGTNVLAGFDSSVSEVSWHSGLPYSDTLTLTASKDKPWSEVWIFSVSPTWRVVFAGVPAVMPANIRAGDWTYEYYPRPGEMLTLKISRPTAVKGGTLAIDNVGLEYDVGKRSTNARLTFDYRSTRGDRHSLKLPVTARVTSVAIDGENIPVRLEKGELPLALTPGAHQVQINWQYDAGAALLTRLPRVDLDVPSSNIDTVVRLPSDRWVLYTGGSGVGPAILYWGELVVFFVLAMGLGRIRRTPLRTYEWLLLGLGLSTFSWSALLLFAIWIFVLRWREELDVVPIGARQFNLLQVGLIALSIAAVVSLVVAIPYGLLGSPDMHVAGSGQNATALSWFNDQAAGELPIAWVVSLSVWWYKAAMLSWALWLAFALVRWLPIAKRALGAGGYWRRTPPPAADLAQR